jgi:hypothetical protein
MMPPAPGVVLCACQRHADAPCEAAATQEDFLCDDCRPGGCVVFYINSERMKLHSPAFEVT